MQVCIFFLLLYLYLPSFLESQADESLHFVNDNLEFSFSLSLSVWQSLPVFLCFIVLHSLSFFLLISFCFALILCLPLVHCLTLTLFLSLSLYFFSFHSLNVFLWFTVFYATIHLSPCLFLSHTHSLSAFGSLFYNHSFYLSLRTHSLSTSASHIHTVFSLCLFLSRTISSYAHSPSLFVSFRLPLSLSHLSLFVLYSSSVSFSLYQSHINFLLLSISCSLPISFCHFLPRIHTPFFLVSLSLSLSLFCFCVFLSRTYSFSLCVLFLFQIQSLSLSLTFSFFSLGKK
ncbi:unnamed protein product [Acanthosepion pharaonis]|uniref:Uncharacterized protein n=1 Tax=Acanthosepion pharaonis TaxID=158019 RepID=A0A812C029_ACAPH|nr:unnamed protein product [Sepia pharaonis]